MLRLALIATASVFVVVSPSSAGLLSDEILGSSNFEKVSGSTPSGAITVSGPEGKKYVLFDLDSHAVFPHHALGLGGPAAHVHLGPGFPSGIGGTLQGVGGWSGGDGDVATGWKHDASGGDGGGSGGASGGSSSSAGGSGGGSGSGGGGGGGGRKGRDTDSLASSAFSSDPVTTDSAGWVVAAAQVPEPATLGLLAAAFALLTATARRREGRSS